MAKISDYVMSSGFNKNIFLEDRDEVDMSKFGMGFFPGNEVLNPKEEEEEEETPTPEEGGEVVTPVPGSDDTSIKY